MHSRRVLLLLSSLSFLAKGLQAHACNKIGKGSFLLSGLPFRLPSLYCGEFWHVCQSNFAQKEYSGCPSDATPVYASASQFLSTVPFVPMLDQLEQNCKRNSRSDRFFVAFYLPFQLRWNLTTVPLLPLCCAASVASRNCSVVRVWWERHFGEWCTTRQFGVRCVWEGGFRLGKKRRPWSAVGSLRICDRSDRYYPGPFP